MYTPLALIPGHSELGHAPSLTAHIAHAHRFEFRVSTRKGEEGEGEGEGEGDGDGYYFCAHCLSCFAYTILRWRPVIWRGETGRAALDLAARNKATAQHLYLLPRLIRHRC
jgi:hypothetical protein